MIPLKIVLTRNAEGYWLWHIVEGKEEKTTSASQITYDAPETAFTDAVMVYRERFRTPLR